jgi:type IV secretion system protein TrbF
VISILKRSPSDEFAAPIHQAQVTTWNERYAVHMRNERHWRAAAFVSFGLLALSVAGNVEQGTQSKIVPYVVERDHLGDEVAVGLANRAMPVDPRTIQAEVSRWVHDVRTVSTDMQDERAFIYEAFDHTDKNGPATNELSQWFKDNIPWVRAKENIVTVEVLSALPMDQNTWHTWRVDWRENTLTRSGVLEQSHVWEVILTVSVIPPRTETEVRKNHAGVFIENFSWSTRGT